MGDVAERESTEFGYLPDVMAQAETGQALRLALTLFGRLHDWEVDRLGTCGC